MNEILNILGSVGFNWHVALANFVNFLIILFLLNKFFFGKIGKTLDERHKVIQHGLTQAHEAETKLAHAHEEHQAIISSARKEKDAIIEKAQVTAHDLASAIEKEAQEVVATRLLKLSQEEADINAKVEKAFAEKAPSLVAALYAKTIAKEMTQEGNDTLIASMRM